MSSAEEHSAGRPAEPGSPRTPAPRLEPGRTLLVARNVSLRLGGRSILSGVSLQLATGEVLGVLGPNGAGKSSLLRALAGLLPVEGTVEVEGQPITSLTRAAIARAMALVPQDPPADVPFTVAEIVLMGRAPHQGRWGVDSTEDRRIARSALEMVDLLPLASRTVDSLSGGERRRAFVARALAQEPRALLLDEPTAFLDMGHQLDLLGRCRTLARQSMGVAVVLHDPTLAASFCDRVVVLHEGRSIAEGPPREALTVDVLRRAFGATLIALHHPTTGAPIFVPE